MIDFLAEFLEESNDEIEKMCDEIYRLNSDYARTKRIIIKTIEQMQEFLLGLEGLPDYSGGKQGNQDGK